MNGDNEHVFEEFRNGRRKLFIIKARDKELLELSILDVAFQKLSENRIGIMFWRNAGEAERFIVTNGRTNLAEVYEIDVNQLSAFVARIAEKQSAEKFCYVLF
jgi:hypothetical protein